MTFCEIRKRLPVQLTDMRRRIFHPNRYRIPVQSLDIPQVKQLHKIIVFDIMDFIYDFRFLHFIINDFRRQIRLELDQFLDFRLKWCGSGI